MIAETEHFILDYRYVANTSGQHVPRRIEDGLTIKIKNVDETSTDLLYVLPNAQTEFMKSAGSYLQTVGTELQDTITSWDLFCELVKLIDEADSRISLAIVSKDFDKYLN